MQDLANSAASRQRDLFDALVRGIQELEAEKKYSSLVVEELKREGSDLKQWKNRIVKNEQRVQSCTVEIENRFNELIGNISRVEKETQNTAKLVKSNSAPETALRKQGELERELSRTRDTISLLEKEMRTSQNKMFGELRACHIEVSNVASAMNDIKRKCENTEQLVSSIEARLTKGMKQSKDGIKKYSDEGSSNRLRLDLLEINTQALKSMLSNLQPELERNYYETKKQEAAVALEEIQSLQRSIALGRKSRQF